MTARLAGESPPTVASLRAAYRDGAARPADVVQDVLDRIDLGDPAAWVTVAPARQLRARAAALEAVPGGPHRLPLYGVPVAVKDNIDVAGLPTTAGCAAFSYIPSESAEAVRLLEEAGAIIVGKTNLDQFATGLVGTRTPFGVPLNPAAPLHIPGGSSSGSATVVAAGQVPLALGTDTAGSGRVPAAMTGIAGWKPTRGIVSARGVVPACRSLDCVSVFGRSVADVRATVAVLAARDARDPYARPAGDGLRPAVMAGALRLGVARLDGLDVDDGAAAGLAQAVLGLRALGMREAAVDLAPFLTAGRLLYAGAWLAERLEAAGALLREQPGALLDVTRTIIGGGLAFSAADAFAAQTGLRELRRDADRVWDSVDLLVVPSVPAAFTLRDVAADPFGVNERLGLFTSFVNLLDLAAVAVPVSPRPDGAPCGVTLIGPAGSDWSLLRLAGSLHGENDADPGDAPSAQPPEVLPLAVVGAHLRGQPLHHQLAEAGAVLLAQTTTAPRYRLYGLAGTTPPKPGLVRDERGARIEVEVYALPPDRFGAFVAAVPMPLAIGPVELDDGQLVSGFLCGPAALDGAVEITSFGGWRAYLAARAGG
jgi:allophanate hydrolase